MNAKIYFTSWNNIHSLCFTIITIKNHRQNIIVWQNWFDDQNNIDKNLTISICYHLYDCHNDYFFISDIIAIYRRKYKSFFYRWFIRGYYKFVFTLYNSHTYLHYLIFHIYHKDKIKTFFLETKKLTKIPYKTRNNRQLYFYEKCNFGNRIYFGAQSFDQICFLIHF